MHRHGYKGRKFGRERAQRTALMRGLAESLVKNGSIVTTKPKAKELAPYFEKLITRAKKGDLASRRMILRDLSVESSHKLVDEIVPKLGGRNSGHLRVKPAGYRRGDNAALASVSFVDEIGLTKKPAAPAGKAKAPTSKEVKTEEVVKPETSPVQTAPADQPRGVADKQAPKRSGVRGNR